MPRWTSLLAYQPLSPSLPPCGRPHDPAHTAAPRTTSRAQPGSPCASSLPQARRPPAGPPRCFWPCIGIPEQRSEARVDTQPEHHGGGEVPDLRSSAIERLGERLLDDLQVQRRAEPARERGIVIQLDGVSTTRRRATSLETEDRAEQGPVHAHIKSEQVGTTALVVVNI